MPQQHNLMVPVSIVVAGVLVAGALFFANRSPGAPAADGGNTVEKVPAITASDHILGNPDAKVVLVEYTDLECPFCKAFHETMKRIMAEYGEGGEVAWVLRNFPLQQIHPNAPRLAEAAECVAELAGNDAYWSFIDAIYALAPVNTFFDMSKLSQTASGVGVSATALDACLASGRYQDKISKEYSTAIATGGQGTPHNVIVTKDRQNIPIPGAQPYETVKSVIDAALREQ